MIATFEEKTLASKTEWARRRRFAHVGECRYFC